MRRGRHGARAGQDDSIPTYPGIYYYFRHTASSHTLVLSEARSSSRETKAKSLSRYCTTYSAAGYSRALDAWSGLSA